MKKVFVFILCATIILCIAGCKKTETLSINSDIPQAVQTKIAVDVTTAVPAKNANAVPYNMGDLSMTSPIRTDAEKFKIDNAVVIHGKVIQANYVLHGSTVFTKSEVEVLKCYQGNLAEGTVINVKELGGFIPSDVFNNAVYQEKFGTDAPKSDTIELLDMRVEDFKVMEMDEDVILFLLPISNSQIAEFKDNSYELIRVWQGKLLYNEEVNAFIPYVPAEELAAVAEEKNNTSVQINSIGEADNGIEARAYTLEEFEVFAAEMSTNNS